MRNDTTSQSLTDKIGDEFDKAFIVVMTEHHNKAIEMAKLAKEKSNRREILDLADNIISAQTNENDQMKSWQFESKKAQECQCCSH